MELNFNKHVSKKKTKQNKIGKFGNVDKVIKKWNFNKIFFFKKILMRIRKDVIEIERIKNKNLRERPKWEKN